MRENPKPEGRAAFGVLLFVVAALYYAREPLLFFGRKNVASEARVEFLNDLAKRFRVLPASVKNRSPGGAAPPRYELWRGLGPRRDSEVANGVNRRLLWPLFLEAALQRLKLPFADESYAVTLLHGLAPGHYLARR